MPSVAGLSSAAGVLALLEEVLLMGVYTPGLSHAYIMFLFSGARRSEDIWPSATKLYCRYFLAGDFGIPFTDVRKLVSNYFTLLLCIDVWAAECPKSIYSSLCSL
jgi:hypothetical protein